MATTADAIRSRMAALIAAIVPAVHAGQRFVESRYEDEFRPHYEANPAGCLRRFAVLPSGDTTQALVTSTQLERNEETMLVEVVYNVDWRHGGRQLAGLYAAIASDAKQIDAAVGPPSSDATLKGLATIFRTTDYSRERSGPVVFLSIPFRIEFARSLA